MTEEIKQVEQEIRDLAARTDLDTAGDYIAAAREALLVIDALRQEIDEAKEYIRSAQYCPEDDEREYSDDKPLFLWIHNYGKDAACYFKENGQRVRDLLEDRDRLLQVLRVIRKLEHAQMSGWDRGSKVFKIVADALSNPNRPVYLGALDILPAEKQS